MSMRHQLIWPRGRGKHKKQLAQGGHKGPAHKGRAHQSLAHKEPAYKNPGAHKGMFTLLLFRMCICRVYVYVSGCV